MEISRFLADKIELRLKSLRINRQQFALMVKQPPSTITKWLGGNHNFTIATIQVIQDVLKVNFFAYQEGIYNPCAPCVFENTLLH